MPKLNAKKENLFWLKLGESGDVRESFKRLLRQCTLLSGSALEIDGKCIVFGTACVGGLIEKPKIKVRSSGTGCVGGGIIENRKKNTRPQSVFANLVICQGLRNCLVY